jgi:hypothetical protein
LSEYSGRSKEEGSDGCGAGGSVGMGRKKGGDHALGGGGRGQGNASGVEVEAKSMRKGKEEKIKGGKEQIQGTSSKGKTPGNAQGDPPLMTGKKERRKKEKKGPQPARCSSVVASGAGSDGALHVVALSAGW